MTCPACDGRGSVACYAGFDDFGNAEYLAVDCPECTSDGIPTVVNEEMENDTDGTPGCCGGNFYGCGYCDPPESWEPFGDEDD